MTAQTDPLSGTCGPPAESLGLGGCAPLEWSVCPGAAESASMSDVPHGTIITAASFTSLSLLHCELAGEEKVQYEVHLLTSGLLQCGWCVSPSGLPFSQQEGVGDFPMSVAADGLRGLVWNLTPVDVPELRWSAGDTLSCYADLATGVFDFSLNGRHCHSASLPTKALLLRHGARWYSDRHSTDEMLQYTPAMSLEGGEACVVNLGEAPMRYPRRGYRTICETFWYALEERLAGAAGTVYTPSATSTAVPPAAGGGWPAGHASRTHGQHCGGGGGGGGGGATSVYVSGSSSNSSFGAQYNNTNNSTAAAAAAASASLATPWCCLTLGGVDVAPFIKSVGLQVPMNVPMEGTYLFYRMLDSWVEEPTRVVERCARLVSWLQSDAPGRWKAFTVWLYLWVTRFYVLLRDVPGDTETCVNLDGLVVLSANPSLRVPASARAYLNDIWHALELFMPPSSFALIPGMILALLQHRCSDTAEMQLGSLQIALDLVSIPSFRRTWVADTASFTSTLLNVFMIRPLGGTRRDMLAHALSTCTPNAFIERADLTSETCAHQAELWHVAAQLLEELVRDPQCRGGVSVAVLRYILDKRLSRTIAAAHRGDDVVTVTFLDDYPYTFASAFSPTVMAVLTLALTAALGTCMPPLSDGDEKVLLPSPPSSVSADPTTTPDVATASAAVLQQQLSWRAVATAWLPPARFYSRPLAAPSPISSNSSTATTAAVKDCIADRLGGSLPTVAADIAAEVARLEMQFTTTPAPSSSPSLPLASSSPPSSPPSAAAAAAASGVRQSHASGGEQKDHASDGNSCGVAAAHAPSAEAPTTFILHPSLSTREQQWREVAAWHLDRRCLFTSLPTDDAGLGTAGATSANTTTTSASTASTAAAGGALIDADSRLADALAERADELLLVAVIAFDVYVRGLVARCATLPSTIYHAVVQHQRTLNDKSAALETWNSTTSISGGDEAAQVRRVFELLLTTVPLTEDRNSAALANLCGVVGRVCGYYWARMSVFERCFCLPGQQALYAAMEAAEAVHAPPRAFLMLPAQLVNVFVDMWLLLGLMRGHNADMAAQAPLLFRFFFDANVRRATSNLFARGYLYQAMTSVLGAGREDRLRIAQHLARLHDANPAERADRLSFMARHFADLLEMTQRSPNERAPVNFLSSLLQEEGALMPPPRMIDEKFGWLLHRQQQTASPADAPAAGVEREAEDSAAPPARRTRVAAVKTADALYAQLLSECTMQHTPAALLFPLLHHANALLSRYSERLPPPSRWADATGDSVTCFYTLHHVLRKTLCAMNAVCEALLLRQRSSCSFHGSAAAAAAASSLFYPCAVGGSALSSSSSSSGDCVSDIVEVERREDIAALRRELMDVLLQCLQRVMGPPSPGLEDFDAIPPQENAADSNVLQPAVVCDVGGTFHWREVGCTKAGLIAPIFAMLLRFLDVGNSSCDSSSSSNDSNDSGNNSGPEELRLNVFLAAVGAELPVLVRTALSALAHTAWWSAATPDEARETTNNQIVLGNGDGDAGDDVRDGTAPQLPERLARLQCHLRDVKAACATLFPSELTHSAPTRSTTTTATSSPSAASHIHPQDRAHTVVHSRSFSNASANTAECAPAGHTGEDDGDARSLSVSHFAASSSSVAGLHSPACVERSGVDVEGEAEAKAEGETGATAVCLICCHRRIDVRMLPCRHECCYGCYRRYQRTEHARQVAKEGSGQTRSSTRTPSPPLTISWSRANSEGSGVNSWPSAQTSSDYHGRGNNGEDEGGLQVLTEDSITLSSVEHSIAAAEYVAVRCFFCKETVVSVERIFKHDR